MRARRARTIFEHLETRRMLAAGDQDMLFGGGDGVATFSTAAAAQIDRAGFVAVDSQGRIITAGLTAANRNAGTPGDILIARFTPDGEPDPTFGGGAGSITRSFLNSDTVTDLAVQPDGRILVAFVNAAPASWGVMRLEIDGTPDDTFGNNGEAGFASHDFGSETITRMVLQGDGKIVTAGLTASPAAGGTKASVVRMLDTGALDNNFDQDGMAILSFPSTSLNSFFDVTMDGTKIVAAGRSRPIGAAGQFDRIAVARLLENGAPDNSFEDDGMTEIAIASNHAVTHSVAVDSQSRVTVAGFVAPNTLFEPRPINFWRLTSAGLPDATFNAAGANPGRLAVPEVTLFNVDSADLLVQPDDKLLFGGAFSSATSNAFQLVRIDTDGTLDESFSENGTASFTPTAPTVSNGADLALDPSRRIVMTGLTAPNFTTDWDLALIRVQSGLPAVTGPVSLEGGALRIRGTEGDDTVLLRRDGTDFLATFNGALHTFPAASVLSIDVELYGGNDHQTHDGGVPGGRIDLGGGNNNSVTLNAGNLASPRLDVSGGAGNDTMTVRPGAATPVFFDGGDDPSASDYVNYHGTAGDDTFNITATRINRGGADVVEYARVSNFTLEGGFGFDIFNVTGASPALYDLNGGDGNDAFNLINGVGDTIHGNISANGGAGTDEMTFDARGGGPQGATIIGNIANFNGQMSDFDVETLKYYLNDADAGGVFLEPSASMKYMIYGGGPQTYPGDRLTISTTSPLLTHARTTVHDGYFNIAGVRKVDYFGFERVISPSDTTAPTVSAQFQHATQRIVFTFSEDVQLSIDLEDLTLLNLTTNQTILGNSLVLTKTIGIGSPTTARWNPFANQTLPDGVYKATLPAAAIRDYADRPLAADFVFHFIVLAGDLNGDGEIAFTDLLTVSANFGKKPATYEQGDTNRDGEVAFGDLLTVAAKFGQKYTLPSAPSAAAAAPIFSSAPIVKKTPLKKVKRAF